MKYVIILGFLFFLAGYTRAQQTIINDPNASVRPGISGFHAIHVSNAIELYLSQGEEETVAVSASEIKYRDRIRTEVKDGVLKIWYEKDGWLWDHGHNKIRAYVSCKKLDQLNASGASNVYVDGTLSGENLNIDLSGASDFKGIVKFNTLKLDQSGASDVSITGSAANLTIRASGASDVKGYGLVTENCNVQASGASDIRISVNKELVARASGASSIYFKGTGMIKELHSNGASSVSKED
ncbi:MAG TPA: head GIN domain-containing protein [Puia sp.]|nr:head GIN domain-containing protein [Puia sp.]